MQLKDRRHVEFLKPPSTQSTEPQKINLEEYQDQKQDQEALTVSTTEPQKVEWGHLVNQLNQDPQKDSIADSNHGMPATEEGEVDAAGDEELEGQDEGAMARAAPEAGVTNITWNPKDPGSCIDTCVDACQRDHDWP